MKLAEALALRAEDVRKFERLRERIKSNARYQEGEQPSEDASELLDEAREALDHLEDMVRRINRTNAVATVGPDMSMTAALARRDALKLHHSIVNDAADAAAGASSERYFGHRQLRSELRMIPAMSVVQLRQDADAVAAQLRQLDVMIQARNWEVDLLD